MKLKGRKRRVKLISEGRILPNEPSLSNKHFLCVSVSSEHTNFRSTIDHNSYMILESGNRFPL